MNKNQTDIFFTPSWSQIVSNCDERKSWVVSFHISQPNPLWQPRPHNLAFNARSNTPFLHCTADPQSLLSEHQERQNLSTTYLDDGQNLLKLVLLQFSVWKIAQLAVVLSGEEKAKGRWSCLSNCKIPTQFVILSHQQNTKPTKLV